MYSLRSYANRFAKNFAKKNGFEGLGFLLMVIALIRVDENVYWFGLFFFGAIIFVIGDTIK